MASLKTSILILMVGLIISAPLVVLHTLEGVEEKNQTAVDTGVSIDYDVTSNLILVNYTNKYNDTEMISTRIYTSNLGMDIPVYTNETDMYPATITYAPTDSGLTYLVVLTSMRSSGNYTYSHSVKPSEYGGIFDLFGG